MVEISTTHFYSDKEYTFPKGFQSGHLLLEAWDAGIRPLPVCLYRTLGCTQEFLDLPWILTIMCLEKLVMLLFCLLKVL